MNFAREELLAALTGAGPALNKSMTIPELTHFWFDQKYVYAYDGSLGVRLSCKTDLDCGLPGTILLELLKTSTLKEVELGADKNQVVLKMGKSKINLASLAGDRKVWSFPAAVPKQSPVVMVLSERMIEALRQISFVRMTRPIQPIHEGVILIPQKGTIDFYATDSRSIARVTVTERPIGVSKLLLPWAFVECVLGLVEPGALLHVLDDCLMVENKGVMICSNLMELPETPDIPKVLDSNLDDTSPIGLPTGLRLVLDRAAILAGQDEAVLNVASDGQTITLQGKYAFGSLDEKLSVKSKIPSVKVRLSADLIGRALSYADSFVLNRRALVLYGGEDFLYLAASHS